MANIRLLLLGSGLLLAGLWTAGVIVLLKPAGWLVHAALTAAGLPLIFLQLADLDRGWLDRERIGARIRDAIALSTPLGLFWALNHPALNAWWIRDDPCHLVLIQEHGIWRPFVHSIGFFLTPLLNFSLGVDVSLFGLEPRAFYSHQLLAFSVLIVVGYRFLRIYLRPAGASLALALFVVSVPAFAVARLLMNRHYLEGLILALVALALYRRSITSDRYLLAILGAALYLLATTAKEVFVPLIMLLPFLAAGDLSRRWRHGLPFALAAAIYGLWRLTMLGLGNSLSAYGALSGEFHFATLLEIPRLVGITQPWQLVIAGVASATAVLALSRRSRPTGLAIGAGLIALAAPIAPVAARLEPRHLFLWAFAIAAVLAAGLEASAATSRHRGLAPIRALAATLLLLLALACLTHSTFWRHFDPTVDQHRSEGRFVFDDSREGLLLTEVNHSTFLQCLAQLRRDVVGKPGGPGFCGDACFCSEGLPQLAGKPRWRYEGGRIATVEDVTGDCNAGRPLAVALSHDQASGTMSWTFGPYDDGVYEVLLLSGVETLGVSIPVTLPQQGSLPYWLSEPLHFVVKYRSSAGWQTYSPVYTVEPDGAATIEP